MPSSFARGEIQICENHRSRKPVAGVQRRPRSLAFEHSDLLAESQDFQSGIGSGPEQSAHGDQEGEEELDHELTVLTRRNATPVDALDVRATR